MSAAIPRPPRRFLTRLLLPAIILLGAVAVLLWTSWRSLVPARVVQTMPVIIRTASASAGAPTEGASTASASTDGVGPTIQAPGWVEPAPFPILVPALTPGIIRSVLVLEGERVTKEQVVAELYDEEASIALQLADAALAETSARRDEMQDELARKRPLVKSGAVSAGEVARLELRLRAMDASVHASEADRALKALVLERTKVRAPIDGVVMTRLASPGTAAGGMQDAKPIVELYDPTQLQVRADVPLSDAALLAIGTPAEIKLDVLPNRVFHGEVVRVVNQADIAKNTLQAKVRITDPAPELKPEMLARVKIMPRQSGKVGAQTGRQRIWASASFLDLESTPPRAMAVADLKDGVGLADERTLQLTGAREGDWVEVGAGLRAGDLLIARAGGWPAAKERVRIAATPGPASNGGITTGVPHGNH